MCVSELLTAAPVALHPPPVSAHFMAMNVCVAVYFIAVLLVLCFSCCHSLSRDDPQVERKQGLLTATLCFDEFLMHFGILGLIRKYWFQYKKIEVILAYLRIVHHVAIGYVSLTLSYVISYYHVLYNPRLTWLKSKLNELGLHRRGPLVNYSPVSRVQEAIEVQLPLHTCTCTVCI